MSYATDDPHTSSPAIKTIADALPTLTKLERTCSAAGFKGEGMICAVLLQMLAELVDSDSPPSSDEHAAARAVLDAYL